MAIPLVPKILSNLIEKWQAVSLVDANGQISNVQNPISVDGDSIYAKDIDVSRSLMNGFDGEITDLVSGLHSINKDESATNPKTIFMHFNRSLLISLIGIGNSEGAANPNAANFSNIKIVGLTSGAVERVLYDQSSDNTKRTTAQIPVQAIGVNAIRFEFHTADGVGLTNFAIPKNTFVSVAQSIAFASNSLASLLKNPLNADSPDMNVDGSGTPVDFVYEVPLGKTLKLERSFLAMKDGVSDFTSTNFGAISGSLTNGVDIIITHLGAEYLLATWKTNFDISLTMYDFFNPYKDGAYAGRWTFSKDVGNPFTLEQGDKIIIRIKDDLTALDLFQMSIKGKI